MEIEKILTLAAPPARVWALLLDPTVMGGCVPGMKSIEVDSDVEYLAEMHVKIALVNARFKIKTMIVETQPPHYLRSEGTGEDGRWPARSTVERAVSRRASGWPDRAPHEDQVGRASVVFDS